MRPIGSSSRPYHVDFLTVRDPSARIPRLYGTIKIPETYVIDSKGVLRRKFVSAQNVDEPGDHRLPGQTHERLLESGYDSA